MTVMAQTVARHATNFASFLSTKPVNTISLPTPTLDVVASAGRHVTIESEDCDV